MTEVGTVQQQNISVSEGLGIDRGAFDGAVEDFLNLLASTRGRTRNMDRAKVNEEQLYGALMLERLRRDNPDAASKFEEMIPSLFKKFKEGSDAKPIFNAVDKALQKLGKQGLLDKALVDELKKDVLGAAQVDNKKGRLGSRRIEFRDKGEVPAETTYLDRVFSKVDGNSSATDRQVSRIQKGFDKAEAKGVEYAPAKKKAKIVEYEGSQKTAEPKREDAPVVESDVQVEISKGKDVRFGVWDFGYKPYSQKDDNALVQIPFNWADKVNLVEIYSPEGELLSAKEPNWKEDDGRRYARFDKPGTEFGKNFIIKLTLVDGGYHEEKISDSSSIHSRGFE